MRKKYRKKVLCLRPSVEFISFRFFFSCVCPCLCYLFWLLILFYFMLFYFQTFLVSSCCFSSLALALALAVAPADSVWRSSVRCNFLLRICARHRSGVGLPTELIWHSPSRHEPGRRVVSFNAPQVEQALLGDALRCTAVLSFSYFIPLGGDDHMRLNFPSLSPPRQPPRTGTCVFFSLCVSMLRPASE